MPPNGTYTTKNGSTVIIHGRHGGKVSVEFDWLEEDNACCDCVVNPYPEDGFLTWSCDVCGGGSAELIRMDEKN